ncbi:MAG: M14 family zinc carboxypeptidase [bacterium]
MPSIMERIMTTAARRGVPAELVAAGESRQGRRLHGLRVGCGPRNVSLTAGAHSDEPAGPMAALALAEWLADSPAAHRLIERFRFHICPNVNPDGAEANRAWFADPQDPLEYLRLAVRELPGDDVEFGYPDPRDGISADGIRPENRAIADFLSGGAPYVFHASLHSMAFAEGAWFLIGREWVARTKNLRRRLAEAATAAGLPLHDVDRHGEKGFTRIEKGFCTTPTSAGMKAFFLIKGDESMAARFNLSSMELAQALGGDPLVMVSEIPLFVIGNEETLRARGDPPREDTLFRRFQPRLPRLRALACGGGENEARAMLRQFSCWSVPFAVQLRLIANMVIMGIDACG